jgi:peptidoglycan/xylan/chitin deacetylase (PgdA/CDA1 family)
MKIPVLMYHYIGVPQDPKDRPYYVSAKQFAKHIEFINRRGFQTIGLSDLVEHLYHSKPIDQRSVIITFDDGHISFAEKAFPILSYHRCKATMFLITSRIGERNYMDWPEIYDMQNHGISFQSHSLTHAILTKIKLDNAKKEISTSKKILEDKLAQKVDFFAYRGGHFNTALKGIVKASGYAAAVCSKHGYNTSLTDRYELKRVPVRSNDNIFRFGAKIYGRNLQNRLYMRIAHYLLR